MSRKVKSTPGPYLLRMELMRDQIQAFDQYPYNLPSFRNLNRLAIHPKVTFFVGENGTGKSTLLEALAVSINLNPEGGSRNFNFATRSSHSDLEQSIRVVKTVNVMRDCYFLRAESFYNVATEVDKLGPEIMLAYGGQSLHEQSHGESFFALFKNRFKSHGLYLMDEPEAALSPQRQLEFLALMHSYCKEGSQFVIATHSPIIMAYPDSIIYGFTDSGITEEEYENTQHYAITRSFLTNPKKMLDILMSDQPAENE